MNVLSSRSLQQLDVNMKGAQHEDIARRELGMVTASSLSNSISPAGAANERTDGLGDHHGTQGHGKA